MKIEWIKIKGFRNFVDETINFADQTLIIGANDIGKSNLIFALRILFDRGLSERDLDLYDSDYNVYTRTDSIEITVKLKDVTEDCLITVFKENIKDETVYIQYKNTKNEDFSILSGPTEESLEEKDSRYYIKRLNMEYVDANRNLDNFMRREKNKILEEAKESLEDQQLEEDNTSINQIQGILDDINGKIDNLHYVKQSLSQVNEELEKLAIHNKDQKLNFKNNDSDASLILNNLKLAYNTDNGPLTLGGDGRNNQIFLATWMTRQKNINTREKVTFYAIEEPEAHLHPHQQRKLSSYLLENFNEQVFITTHSPHIASEFKPDRIVKLYSRNKRTQVAKGGCSEHLQLKFDDFGYRLDAITSEVFFVNAVFLVEGPSERLFYTALAKQIGVDLDQLNVSIIAVNGVGFIPYIKICLALDIPFVLRTDNDISTKTKGGIKMKYQAGISRIMKIHDELSEDLKDELLSAYWDEHILENEWDSGIEKPEKAILLADYITEKLETANNIFLSNNDLENDLVNSDLYTSLAEFYEMQEKETIVKNMQKAKAGNMMDFLKKYQDSLRCLVDDRVSMPLKRMVEEVEEIIYDKSPNQ